MARATILEYLDNFRRHAGEVAYVFRRGYRVQRWTYGDVLRQTYRFARALEARGHRQGRQGHHLGRELRGMGRRLFWLPVARRDRRSHRQDRRSRLRRTSGAAGGCQAMCWVGCTTQFPGVPHFELDTLREQLAELSAEPYRHARVHATTSCRLSSPPARPPSPAASSSRTATSSPTWNRWNARSRQYLKYERIFHPLRFLNLLPLSHVFGQFLGIFLPQLLAGTVLFQDTLNPTEVMRTIKNEARVGGGGGTAADGVAERQD